MKSILSEYNEKGMICPLCERNTAREEWRQIEGYEGYYEVSNLGRVRSVDRIITDKNGVKYKKNGHISSLINKDNGYMYISLNKNGKRKNHYVHRLVANAFIPNPQNKTCVNHKDYNRKNNSVDNLEWCTQEENINYSIEHLKQGMRKVRKNNRDVGVYPRYKNGQIKRWRVIVGDKEYPSEKTKEEAIRKRAEYVKEINYYGV